MTKSIEELALEWGVDERVAEEWVEDFADVPEGFTRLCPNNLPELPINVRYNGLKGTDSAGGSANFTKEKTYTLAEPNDFFVVIMGATGEVRDDDGDVCPISPAALGQFVIPSESVSGGAK